VCLREQTLLRKEVSTKNNKKEERAVRGLGPDRLKQSG